jgi:hypothetical protein
MEPPPPFRADECTSESLGEPGRSLLSAYAFIYVAVCCTSECFCAYLLLVVLWICILAIPSPVAYPACLDVSCSGCRWSQPGITCSPCVVSVLGTSPLPAVLCVQAAMGCCAASRKGPVTHRHTARVYWTDPSLSPLLATCCCCCCSSRTRRCQLWQRLWW